MPELYYLLSIFHILNGSPYLVVHLFGAVKDVDHNAERASQILGGLRLARASGSRGGATHRKMERLSQCDVTSVKDNQTTGWTWVCHFKFIHFNLQPFIKTQL